MDTGTRRGDEEGGDTYTFKELFFRMVVHQTSCNTRRTLSRRLLLLELFRRRRSNHASSRGSDTNTSARRFIRDLLVGLFLRHVHVVVCSVEFVYAGYQKVMTEGHFLVTLTQAK